MTHSNGEAVTTDHTVDTVILRYDRQRDLLEIGGHCNSLDLMLDVLARATRTVETKHRQAAALELQRMVDQQRREQVLAASIMGKR